MKRFSAVLGILAFVCSAFTSEPTTSVALKQVAEGFTSPTVIAPMPDGRLLIADQIGTVHILNKDGSKAEQLFLDVRPKLTKLNTAFDERGLLGLALHPKFKENGKLYVYYSAPKRPEAPEDWDHTSHVSEFKAVNDKVDLASERLLLAFDKPYFNHNSGRTIFGPDGYLYIGVGDGGNANDQGKRPETGNGQNTGTFMGKILRLDINKGEPYAIPRDNPFADGKKGKPEIYAYGLRNPWGISFDQGGTHELFASDVGQDRFEEVNIIVKGGNYGWNIREGFGCFDPKAPTKPSEDCPKKGANGEPLLDPILAYKNFKGFPKDPEATGTSITGGYVYRGKTIPELQGKYIFADWSRNWVKADGVLLVASRANGKWTWAPLEIQGATKGSVGAYVTAFGQDNDGEIYVMSNGRNILTGTTGKVYKIVKAGT
jgi:glucose/arabinose dehydrogenase